ncbi:Beta-galactosidase, domain 3 [Rhizoctonia solani]|uniref:beta-galactosidase n=2 Tax=Rhizoctonia solani TaxID=456999 RepID=A0A8H7H1W7_9AGAM|nr:Beta-galactosidase, domain 3 [Rhizoctonia solani]
MHRGEPLRAIIISQAPGVLGSYGPDGARTDGGRTEWSTSPRDEEDGVPAGKTSLTLRVRRFSPATMKLWSSVLGAGALLSLQAAADIHERQANSDQSSNYIPSPGSSGFYVGNSTAAVTFDQHSILLDGKRIMVFAGEFHPWRQPSIPLWRDILEKMKAGGYNAVSIYLHWGITEGKRGTLNFEGHRSVTKFLDVAKQVGILVIVRPGPYINAETAGGGLPGWTTNLADRARSNGTDFTAAWTPWISQVSKYVAPYQYPDGPVIAMQSENEFLSDGVEPELPYTYGHTDYMRQIIATMRKNGITKIPITYNDFWPSGRYASGAAKVDLYGWDAYPLGFDCTNPSVWKEVDANMDAYHQNANPAEPLYLAEYQGGSIDFWKGSGFDACSDLVNEQFANVFYKNNYAAGAYLQSLYMTYGGTNWGNLAYPGVYTSYDYAASISEDRTLRPKFSEIKLQGLFLHATPHYHLAGRISTGTSLSSSQQIFTTHLATPQGQNLYIVRQTTNNNTARVEFDLKVNTTGGQVTLPGLALNGRESKIIVSEYPFGKSLLRYSTGEIATWTTIDGEDHILLYSSNQTITTALYTTSTTKPTITGSNSIKTTSANNTVVVSGPAPASGLARVTIGQTSLWLVNQSWLAPRLWQPRVSGTSGNGRYDLSPRTGSVLVFGPYLVRSATIKGTQLALVGDLESGTTTELEVLAPTTVKSVSWNGKAVPVSKTLTGTLRGTVAVKDLAPKLPNLTSLEWRCADSLPEVALGFDDSKWTTATKTTTFRPVEHQPLGGKLVLYADEYGYHQGNLLYRGRFGSGATGVKLSVQGGFNFGFSAFLNGAFLGSGQGRPESDPSGGTDLVNVTYTFPVGSIQRDNILTVVVDNMGIHENWNANDEFKVGFYIYQLLLALIRFKAPRGIRGYELLGSGDFTSWKLTGNVDGENTKDIIRGPLHEGGLYVERIGAIFPNYKFTSAWNSSKTDASCSPYVGINKAGIKAYKTKFNLSIDQSTDVTVAFKLDRNPNSNYRARLYVNGWQFGRHVSNLGPQTVYPIPEGILNHRGENDVLLTIWSLDSTGAKIPTIELVASPAFASSKEVVRSLAA